ncbi:hypothetical protein [Treponema pedis]|nr:hypothetical protein [Treponema pedis]
MIYFAVKSVKTAFRDSSIACMYDFGTASRTNDRKSDSCRYFE